jgi:hypothetical protein
MSPFGNYQHVVPAAARHCPSGRCAVCGSHPAQLRQEFDTMVRRPWNPAEIDILSRAARSALL